MGYPMVGWLRRAGLEVTVINRAAAKARAWAEEYGGRITAMPLYRRGYDQGETDRKILRGALRQTRRA
jgi:hypothetical protein